MVEDNGYDRSSVNIVRSNYLATIILKSGVNLSLKKKENMRYRGSDTCYVLYYGELIVGIGVILYYCIDKFIKDFYSKEGLIMFNICKQDIARAYYGGIDRDFNDILFDAGNELDGHNQHSTYTLSQIIILALIRSYGCGCTEQVLDTINLYFSKGGD